MRRCGVQSAGFRVAVDADDGPMMVCAAVEGLREHFGIGHATIQIETCDTAADCAQRADDVV